MNVRNGKIYYYPKNLISSKSNQPILLTKKRYKIIDNFIKKSLNINNINNYVKKCRTKDKEMKKIKSTSSKTITSWEVIKQD